MNNWFRVFFAIWLIFFSLLKINPFIPPIFLTVLAVIVFITAMMDVIKKK